MNPGFKTGFAVAAGVIVAIFVFSLVSGFLK
jgi:threonine/homoserine/homoserine lactone efflux protein